jgi:hypothetical protein
LNSCKLDASKADLNIFLETFKDKGVKKPYRNRSTRVFIKYGFLKELIV